MNHLIQNLENLHHQFVEKNKIDTKKSTDAFQQFVQLGIPNKKDEEYKYTNLAELKEITFALPTSSEMNLKEINHLIIHEDFDRLVFINGVLSQDLSKIGADINNYNLSYQLQNNNTLLHDKLGKIVDQNLAFVELSQAFSHNGFFLHLKKNQIQDNPIQLLYITTESAEDTFNPIRNFVYAEENTKVEIIETHYNLGNQKALHLVLTEIYSSSNAHVFWHKIQNDTYQNYAIDHCFVQQNRDSMATVNTFSFGGKITRNNLDFIQNGENIQSYMNGISLIDADQLVDHHTAVHHNQPNCQSFQTYKGIFDGNAKGVFNGKVFVNKIAQKTNAYQQNNNILLSKGASIDTKPQLEIFADDVKCSHGCTVGQLNEEALFYMRARGINKKSAQALLLFAFANDALEHIDHDAIRDYIMKLVSKKLKVEMTLS